MFFEVASVVVDAIRVLEFPQESDFFEDVLPFFQGLFTSIRHFLDGNHLICNVVSSIINGAETSVTDFAKVVKQPFGVLAFKEECHIGVFKTARPKNLKKMFFRGFFKIDYKAVLKQGEPGLWLVFG